MRNNHGKHGFESINSLVMLTGLMLFGISVLASECRLDAGWTFSRSGSNQWLPAIVPGNIYRDLMLNKQIEHPYKSANESKFAYVDPVTWEYRCELPESVSNFREPELIFKGLDTYASIYLNDCLLGETNNMFRIWKFDSLPLLPRKNILIIRFHSALKKADEMQAKHSIKYPGGSKMFCRKAAFQFGWDWAPALEGCGIRQEVIIREKPRFQLLYPQISTISISDSTALLRYAFVIVSDTAMGLNTKISCDELQLNLKLDLMLKSGSNSFQGEFQVRNPDLWYPNEQGKQKLYLFSFQAQALALKKTETISLSAGIRTIQLDQAADGFGSHFRFLVNGTLLYARGANMVPGDMLDPYSLEKTTALLIEAKQNHFNMIRVWGGGIYLPDRFYELCDSLGLMVWQDFMFANGMVPYQVLKENILAELRENVLRIRRFTSPALWCGNNEILEGWNNWGWQKEYGLNKEDSTFLINEYTALFNQAIPSLLKREDPNRSYWSGSPGIGWGRPQAYEMGDVHYWGVWWGMQPFETYRYKAGRFSSEFGFQGMPSSYSLKAMSGKKVKRNYRQALSYHQRHPRGFETMDAYRLNYFLKSSNLETELYSNALTQLLGIETALEAQAYSRPRCMGSLYWQMNDPWPVISWSASDYYHIHKPAHYRIRELYRNIVPVVSLTNDRIRVKVCNDSSSISVKLVLCSYNMQGLILGREEKDFFMRGHSDTIVIDVSRTALQFKSEDSTSSYLVSRIILNGSEYSIRTTLGCRPKFLKTADARVDIKQGESGAFWSYEFSSTLPVFYIRINQEDERNYSDNGFHLLPFERKLVYLPKKQHEKKAPAISFLHLRSAYR